MLDNIDSFKKKNILARLAMPISELEDYYREQRKYWLVQGKKLQYIRVREYLYPFIVMFLKLDRIFRGRTIEILGEIPKFSEPTIFACTHTGGEDAQCVYESLGRGCWWFVGDPCVLYKDISGLLLHMNGSVFLETMDKTDRHIAYLRAVELLKKGGSLMIFPEGARNGTDSIPVMPLFQGTAKMAMESQVKIIPVGVEWFGKHFKIKFGEGLLPENFGNTEDLTQMLRDTLSTLKWDIWESERIQSRSALPKNYRQQFRKKFAKSIYPYDTLEAMERTRFHTREEQEQKDAFIYLSKLIPSRENAFLLRQNRE